MYSQQISATLNLPALLGFLVDLSGSMTQPWGGGTGRSKAEEVADVVNRILETLLTQCSQGEQTREYFQLFFVCYGGADLRGLGGKSPQLFSVSQLKGLTQWEKRWKKTPDGAGGLVEVEVDFPVWLRPEAEGNTPMHLALEKAVSLVQEWTGGHPNSFPPLVFNITDGQPDSPSDAEREAETLRRQRTSDGSTLLFNCHISETCHSPVILPSSDRGLPDDFCRLLFRMSSVLPSPVLARARSIGYEISDGARALVYNADPVALVHLLDIGTRPLNLLIAGNE